MLEELPDPIRTKIRRLQPWRTRELWNTLPWKEARIDPEHTLAKHSRLTESLPLLYHHMSATLRRKFLLID
jgi:hypothetical protein